MRRFLLVLVSALALGGIGTVLFLSVQARRAYSREAPRAIIQISRRVPTLLSDPGPPQPEDEYRTYVQSKIHVMASDRILTGVVKDTRLRDQHLEESLLRSQLLIRQIEGTDLIEVKLAGFEPQDAETIINILIEKFQTTILGSERSQQESRLAMFRRLWDSQQDMLRGKRESLRSIAARESVLEPAQLDLVRQRLSNDTLEADRLELAEQGAKARIDRLKGIKAPTEEEARSLRKNEDDLSVYSGQLGLLRKRIKDLSEQIEKTRQIDLSREQEEISLETETAREILRKVEALSIEREAPSRIMVIQPARAPN